jgi:hypothetical protein
LGGISLICMVVFVLTLKKNHSKNEKTSIAAASSQPRPGSSRDDSVWL